jgi:hypothetical protein
MGPPGRATPSKRRSPVPIPACQNANRFASKGHYDARVFATLKRGTRTCDGTPLTIFLKARETVGGPTTLWSGRAATGIHTFRTQPPNMARLLEILPRRPGLRTQSFVEFQEPAVLVTAAPSLDWHACPEAVQAWHTP